MVLEKLFFTDILVWEFESLNFPCPVSVLVMYVFICLMCTVIQNKEHHYSLFLVLYSCFVAAVPDPPHADLWDRMETIPLCFDVGSVYV